MVMVELLSIDYRSSIDSIAWTIGYSFSSWL